MHVCYMTTWLEFVRRLQVETERNQIEQFAFIPIGLIGFGVCLN